MTIIITVLCVHAVNTLLALLVDLNKLDDGLALALSGATVFFPVWAISKLIRRIRAAQRKQRGQGRMGERDMRIKCKSYKSSSYLDPIEYDCGWEKAEAIDCENCIINGGDMSPVSGKRFRGNRKPYEDAWEKRINQCGNEI